MKKLRERLAGMTFREKASYLWTYYKFPILGAVLLTALLIGGAVRLAAPKRDTLVRVVLLAPRDPGAEALDGLLPELGYDPEKTALSLTVLDLTGGETAATSAQMQLLQSLFLAQEVDLLVAEEPIFTSFATRHAFRDPTGFLPPEILEKYRDRLLVLPEDGAVGLRVPADSPLWALLKLPPQEAVCGVAVRPWDLTAAARLTLYLLGEDPAAWRDRTWPED